MLEILLILSLAVILIFIYVLFFLEEKTTNSNIENSTVSSSSLSPPQGQKDEVLIYDSGWKAKVAGYIPPVLSGPFLTVGEGAEGNSTSIVVGKEAKAFSNSNSIVIGNDSYTKKEKSIVLGNNSVLEIEDESHIAIQTDGIEALDKGDLELEEDLFISLKYNGENLWVKAFDPNKFAYFKTASGEMSLISKDGQYYINTADGKTYKKIPGGGWNIFNSTYTPTPGLTLCIYEGFRFIKVNQDGDFYLVTLTEWSHTEKFLFNDINFLHYETFAYVLVGNVFACKTLNGISYCNINDVIPTKNTINNPQITGIARKETTNDILVSFFDSSISSFKLYGWNGTILYEKTDLISIPSEVNLNLPVLLFSFGDFLIFSSNDEIHINNIVVPVGVNGIYLFISEDQKVVAYTTINPDSFNIYDVNAEDNSLSMRKLPIGPIPLSFSNNGDFGGIEGVYEWKTFLSL